jgi:predicted RNA-binding protein with PIN domain
VPKPGWTVIDGYNLLHVSDVFGSEGRTSLERSREALLDWLASRLDQPERLRTTVVFDARDAPPGLPRSGRKHEMQIEFAPRGGEADDVIEALIRDHSSPRQLTVVSSDHRLHRAARRRKATAIDSEKWFQQLRRANPPATREQEQDPPVVLEPEELSDMLDEFEDG